MRAATAPLTAALASNEESGIRGGAAGCIGIKPSPRRGAV
jgi:hypothetical protein